MSNRKSYRPSDFKRFLKHRRRELFQYGVECGCPIAKWTGEEINLTNLEGMPGWINRFVSLWDERVFASGKEFDYGSEALRMLEEIA